MQPILYFVVPCYNESAVLPLSVPQFCEKLNALITAGRVSDRSRLLLVNDGSKDDTWGKIRAFAQKNPLVKGISLSRNHGHQNALLAGLLEAKAQCDITVSLDADGQDDIGAVDRMLDAYEQGCDVVYGVRSNRQSDTFFKRTTAHGFYRLMNGLGAQVVYDHADYRLMSKRALDALSQFKEVNLFLRGMVPMVGFKTACVEYERHERLAGKSHYPLKKMLALSIDGITSLSVRPIRLITAFGGAVSVLSFIGIIWSVIVRLTGSGAAGWASTVSIICFLGGVQLLSLGVIGEYIGKIYLETKARPRYIISDRTETEE